MKLLILKNNIDAASAEILLQGLLQAQRIASTINLSLDFEYYFTTKSFSSLPITNNNILNGHIVDSQEIFQEAKSSGIPFDACLLVYDWTKITPQPTNPNDGGSALQIPIQWYGNYPEVFTEFLLHELSHYFAGYFGVPDKTHLKYDLQWNGKFSQKSNIEYYLYLIEPFLSNLHSVVESPIAPQVILTRNLGNKTQTLGTLELANKKFGCRTLELAWKNNQKNISCIPSGTYHCEWRFMLRDLTYHYQILNVPNRSGIFIHAGNFFFNSKGCVILGSLPQDINKDGQVDLINSRSILSNFEKIMNKQPFTLKII